MGDVSSEHIYLLIRSFILWGKNAELECADCSPGLQWIQQSRLILWGMCLLFFYIKMCAVLCICFFFFFENSRFWYKTKIFWKFQVWFNRTYKCIYSKKEKKKIILNSFFISNFISFRIRRIQTLVLSGQVEQFHQNKFYFFFFLFIIW